MSIKLIIQTSLKLGLLSAFCGGGYYVFKTAPTAYYLVSATTVTSNGQAPSLDLWTISAENVEEIKKPGTSSTQSTLAASAGTDAEKPSAKPETKAKAANTEQKNYKCKTGTNKSKVNDEDCELYSITMEAEKSLIELSKIKAFISGSESVSNSIALTKLKTDLKAKKLFLLKANTSLYKEWKYDSTLSIELLSKEDNKSYATLSVLANVTESQITGESDLVIAKMSSTSITTPEPTTTTYKCSISKETKSSPFACNIVALTEPATSTKIEELKFGAVTIPTTQSAITFTKDKYFLIQWSTNKYPISELEENVSVEITRVPAQANPNTNPNGNPNTNTNPNPSPNTNSNPVTTAEKITFSIESPIFANLIADPALKEVIILK